MSEESKRRELYNFLKENKLPTIYTAEDDPKQILDFDKLLEVYGKQLSKLQTIWVTGGEPFMDDRLIDFVNALSNSFEEDELRDAINRILGKPWEEVLEPLRAIDQREVAPLQAI